MIIKQYVKDFEKLGFGMFVHFGVYSTIGLGEWAKFQYEIPDEEYHKYARQFNPKPDWAMELAILANLAGCRYISLTTRHHDGYSLYDTCGLNDHDAPHSCGRDLVKEFVEACQVYDLVPFFYHTLIDWYKNEDEQNNLPVYLEYLRNSIEILCKNYGKIGGFWFDGMWAKPKEVWEEDKLYSLIRKYQPETIIINNTGISAQGELGHIELDSVTFERGKPRPINMEGAPKYVASEMCEIFATHWGYTKDDLNFKAPAQMIRELADCRRCGCNMLMNVGPMGDGTVQPIQAESLKIIGQWVKYFDEAIRTPRPSGIEVENKDCDFILQDGKNYYLYCTDVPMIANSHVAINRVGEFIDRFTLQEKITSVTWMDNGAPVEFSQEGDAVTVHAGSFKYGRDLVVRVAKIVCE